MALQCWKHVEPSATRFAQRILYRISSPVITQGVQQALEPLTSAIGNLHFARVEKDLW